MTKRSAYEQEIYELRMAGMSCDAAAGQAADLAKNARTEVLNEASALINGQRESDYGTPEQSFGCIAAMWSAYLGKPMTASDVCNMMTLLKVARLRNGPHRDSNVDGAGYMALGAELSEEQNETGSLRKPLCGQRRGQ